MPISQNRIHLFHIPKPSHESWYFIFKPRITYLFILKFNIFLSFYFSFCGANDLLYAYLNCSSLLYTAFVFMLLLRVSSRQSWFFAFVMDASKTIHCPLDKICNGTFFSIRAHADSMIFVSFICLEMNMGMESTFIQVTLIDIFALIKKHKNTCAFPHFFQHSHKTVGCRGGCSTFCIIIVVKFQVNVCLSIWFHCFYFVS